MFSTIRDIIAVIAIGAGATLLVDSWNFALERFTGLPSLSICLLGRWVAHMRYGTFRHSAIAQAAPRTHECALGWATHYAIGITLAGGLVLVAPSWLRNPTLWPAILYGILTVVMPFFLMQPALGLGIASSKARRPTQARLKSLATHTVYGAGLYSAGSIAAAILGR